MTKMIPKKSAQAQSRCSPHGATTNTSPSSFSQTKLGLAIALIAISSAYFFGCRVSYDSLGSRGFSSSASSDRSEDFFEQNAVRVNEDIPMLFLQAKNEPLVLLNTKISREVPRWTSTNIAELLTSPEISGVYRSNDSAIFGTYYDYNRPMRTLSNIHNSIRYENNVLLSRQALADAFSPTSTKTKAPYYILATALTSIDPTLEHHMDIRELISLNPAKSSVNIWVTSAGSITPCHFDGYYNMYLQLSGTKRFTLLSPDARSSLRMYPFLHPSFGQCKSAFLNEASGHRGADVPSSLWGGRVEVLLQPGEMLFIPPYWLHEVESVTTSVSVNFWTDIATSSLLRQVFDLNVPGLSTEQFDPSLHIPLTPDEMTILPVHLNTLTGRYILGYVIAIEVVEGCLGKAKTRVVVEDVASRYEHLIQDGTLIDMPNIMREPLSGLLSQWKVPLIAKKKAIKYTELVGDKKLIEELKEYIKIMINLFKTVELSMQPITLGHYVEYLSERVCSTRRASSFISLLQYSYAQHIDNAKRKSFE